jgi:CO/xanthine dehydrogenase Mo-binding subunit
VIVLDVGMALNPDSRRQQMEGCITMGLGSALTEEIHFKPGGVLDRNFGTYSIPAFHGCRR